MADEKTYTEAEHIAILSDRLTKETAELTATVEELTGSKTELENKLDVAESAKAAAEAKAAEAEKALEEFKAEIQEREEAAARKDDRLKALRESAEHLGDDFFEDENRIKRIVAMQDEDFQGYLADLSATAAGAPKTTSVPRESAMQNRETAGTTKTETAARGFLLRRYIAKEA